MGIGKAKKGNKLQELTNLRGFQQANEGSLFSLREFLEPPTHLLDGLEPKILSQRLRKQLILLNLSPLVVLGAVVLVKALSTLVANEGPQGP